MNFILMIILGGVAGWLASIIMKNNHKQGMLMDIVLGVVGSFVGGWGMNMLGYAGVTGFNLYSLAVSVLGACVLVFVGRLLTR